MKYFIASFLILLYISCPAQQFQSSQQLLDSLEKAERFSGTVLIAKNGKTAWTGSFGLADRQHNLAVNPATVFESASITKQFIAASILQLRDEKLLSLDDPLDKYFPLVCLKGILLKNLLSHTSGLTGYEVLINANNDKKRVHFNQDVLDIFKKLQPSLDFPPGEKMEYSNTGFIFLALVIEKISGIALKEYLATKIFFPLGMKQTMTYNTRRARGKVPADYALGYIYDKRYKKISLPDSVPAYSYVITFDGMLGDGNICTTADDLLKWDQALYSGKILSALSIREMNSPFKLNSGEKGIMLGVNQNYGFGVFIRNDADFGTIITHGGAWPGYSSYLFRAIDKNLTFIMLSNFSLSHTIEQRILKTLTSDTLDQ